MAVCKFNFLLLTFIHPLRDTTDTIYVCKLLNSQCYSCVHTESPSNILHLNTILCNLDIGRHPGALSRLPQEDSDSQSEDEDDLATPSWDDPSPGPVPG